MKKVNQKTLSLSIGLQPQNSPPPRPDKPNLTMDHRSTIIKPGSPVHSGRDPVSSMFIKRPSIQEETGRTSTLQRETGRNSTITRENRDSTNGRDSTEGRGSVRYTKPHDVTVDSIQSGYIEDIILSKKRKARLVSRYVLITFILTNLMLVGFSIFGSILVMQHINPCICPASNTPRPSHHSQTYAELTTGSSVYPTLTQSQTQTQDQPSQGRDIQGQDTTGLQDKDYSIYIRVENKTNGSPGSPDADDFWNY